jgi:RNA polymerase sigma factor (sigma-70 family)
LNAHSVLRTLESVQMMQWLETTLKHTVHDVVRHFKYPGYDVNLEQALSGLDRIIRASQSSPSQRLRFEELLRLIDDALTALPELTQKVVCLRFPSKGEGMQIQQIASALNLTDDQVAGRLRRGLKALRDRLEGA